MKHGKVAGEIKPHGYHFAKHSSEIHMILAVPTQAHGEECEESS